MYVDQKDGEFQNTAISKWDERFMELAAHSAQWSKDPSTKVGAVIANDLRQILGIGFNGFPRGMDDDEALYADRPTKYLRVVHAEANAILNAITSVRGHTLYVTMFPCHECAKLIIQSGIKRVVSPGVFGDRWSDSHAQSSIYLAEADVQFDQFLVGLKLRTEYPMTFKDGR